MGIDTSAFGRLNEGGEEDAAPIEGLPAPINNPANNLPDLDTIRLALIQDSPALYNRPDQANELASRISRFSVDYPEVGRMATESVGAAANMSTQDWVAARVAGRLGTNLDSWLAELFMGAEEELLAERGAIFHGSQLLDKQAEVRGAWGDIYQDADEVAPLDVYNGLVEAFGEGIDFSAFSDAKNLTGRGGEWAWDGGSNLAVRVPTKGGEDGMAIALVRLEKGTVIEDSIDAIHAYVAADEGLAHSLDATSDPLPGEQTPIGSAFEKVGTVTSAAANAPGIRQAVEGAQSVTSALKMALSGKTGRRHISDASGTRPMSPAEERDADAQQMADLAMEGRTDGERLAILSAGLFPVGGGTADSIAAMEQYQREGTVTPAQLGQIETQDAYEAFKEALDNRGPVSEVFTEGTEFLFGSLEMIDAFTHSIGIGLIRAAGLTDIFADAPEGMELLMNGYAETVSDSEWISEELGIEGTAAAWTDLGYSLFVAPEMWFSVGGRGGMRAMKAALTDPARLTDYLKHPRFQAAFDDIGRGNVDAVLRWTDGFIADPATMGRLFEAADNQVGREAVQEIMEDAMRHGLALPPSAERVTGRQAMAGMATRFREWDSAAGTAAIGSGRMGRLQNFVVDHVVKVSSNPSRSLSPAEFLHQTYNDIAGLMPDAAGTAWARRFTDLAADAQRGYPNRIGTIVSEQEKLRRTIAGMAGARSHTERKAAQKLLDDLTSLDDLRARAALKNLDVEDRIAALAAPRQAQLDEMIERAGTQVPALRDAQAKLRRLTAERASLSAPRQSQPLQDLTREFYQEAGEKAGVPFRIGDDGERIPNKAVSTIPPTGTPRVYSSRLSPDALDVLDPARNPLSRYGGSLDDRAEAVWEALDETLEGAKVKWFGSKWASGRTDELRHAFNGEGNLDEIAFTFYDEAGKSIPVTMGEAAEAYKALLEGSLTNKTLWRGFGDGLSPTEIDQLVPGHTFTVDIGSFSTSPGIPAARSGGVVMKVRGESRAVPNETISRIGEGEWLSGGTYRVVESGPLTGYAGVTEVTVEQLGTSQAKTVSYQLDWAQVSGRSFGDSEAASRVLSYQAFATGSDLSPEARAGMEAGDFFDQQAAMTLPASPWELVAFKASGGAKSDAWAAVQKRRVQSEVRSAVDTMTNVWITMVLANPITATKVHGDELFRFAQETGALGDSLRAAGSLLPGRVGRYIGGASTRGQAFGRNMSDPLVSRQAWEMVNNPQAAERWVNQALVLNPAFQAYANGEAAWRQFFEETGRWTLRDHSIKVGNNIAATRITATNSYKWMGEAWESWLKLAPKGSKKASQRGEIAETILDHARRGEQIPYSASFFRKAGDVPGVGGGGGNITSRVMNTMFSEPQARRGGVFFDHYYDFAMDIFQNRQGLKVIDEKFLTKPVSKGGPGMDPSEAARAIAAGERNPAMRALKDEGMFLQADLDRAAQVWASGNAERLMYKMGALTLGGKQARDLFPFVRAHLEFLDWYARKLVAPLEFQLPFSSKTFTPQVMGHTIPFNLRMWQRWSGIARQGSREDESEGISPNDIISRLTFLPEKADQFMGASVPSFGYLPSWLIGESVHRDWITEGFLDEAGAVMPGLRYVDSTSDSITRAINNILPDGGRSVRNTAGAIVRMAWNGLGRDDGGGNWFANLMGAGDRPPGLNSLEADSFGDWLKDNWDMLPPRDPSKASTGEPWFDAQTEMDTKAYEEANRADATHEAKNYFNPFNDRADAEYGEIRHYSGLIENARRLEGAGLMTHAEADEIMELWDAYQTGQFDREMAGRFFRLANDTVFQSLDGPAFTFDDTGVESKATMGQWILANHPEMAVNMVGRNEVVGEVPEHLAGAVANGRIITSDVDLRNELWDGGYVTPIPTYQWKSEAQQRIGTAMRNVLEDQMNRLLPFWRRTEREGPDGTKVKVAVPFMESLRNGVKKVREAIITIDPTDPTWQQTVERQRIAIPNEFLGEDGKYHMTGEDFWGLYQGWAGSWAQSPILPDTLRQRLNNPNLYVTPMGQDPNPYRQSLSVDLWNDFEDFNKEQDLLGVERIADWPEEAKEEFRKRFKLATIEFGDRFTADHYAEAGLVRSLGDLDWEPSLPATPADLNQDFVIQGNADEVGMVDGDTLSILTADGELRLRVIGLNAPEQGQEGYGQAASNMADLLDAADEVTIGVFEPERYGFSNNHFKSGTLNYRVNVWLFADGVLIADPSVFSASNPRGIQRGGKVVDLLGILKANRGPGGR